MVQNENNVIILIKVCISMKTPTDATRKSCNKWPYLLLLILSHYTKVLYMKHKIYHYLKRYFFMYIYLQVRLLSQASLQWFSDIMVTDRDNFLVDYIT